MKNFWNDLTWEELNIKRDNNAFVIIPIGSTEQHGPHLPVGTDTFLVSEILKDSVEKLSLDNIVYTLPVWTGFSPYHMEFNGTITLDLKLFIDYMTSVCQCISKHGFKKILFFNGHGGNINILKSICTELKSRFNIRPAFLSYWDLVTEFIQEWRESGPGGIDHACEMETSLMLYKFKDLVLKEKVKKSLFFPKSKYLAEDLIIGGKVSIPFDMEEVTGNGVLGDPGLASEEKGKKLYLAIIDAFCRFLKDFQDWDIDHPENL
jgi:creatinine amidohydrolase